MKTMTGTNGREHLLLLSLLCVAVLGHNRKTVFSIQVTFQSSPNVFNVSFNSASFNRFYNCLFSSADCTVNYIETRTATHLSNVVHVTVRRGQKHPPSCREKSASTWYCTRTRPGTLTCRNKSHTDDPHELGVRPLWKCDWELCPCVYIFKVRHVFYDSNLLQECPRMSLDIITSKLHRARRDYRPSFRSGSFYSSSGSSYSRPKSQSSNGGSQTMAHSSEKKMGVIGLYIFAVIFGCIVLVCIVCVHSWKYTHQEPCNCFKILQSLNHPDRENIVLKKVFIF